MKARRRAKRRRQAADLIRRCFVAVCFHIYILRLRFASIVISLLGILSFLLIRFIKGFIYRHEEYCPENEYFLDHVRYSFLKNLRQNLPKSVLDKSWPTPPPSLVEVQNCPYPQDR